VCHVSVTHGARGSDWDALDSPAVCWLRIPAIFRRWHWAAATPAGHTHFFRPHLKKCPQNPEISSGTVRTITFGGRNVAQGAHGRQGSYANSVDPEEVGLWIFLALLNPSI
jgi:hypothetical protein